MNARVVAGTLAPARAGNTDRWSIDKLPAASRTASGTISNNDYAKLEGIETGATADQTGPEMVTALSGLSGTARLPASAVRDLPADTDTQRTDAEIEALAKEEIADWAEIDDKQPIPYDKLPPLDSIVRLTGQTGVAEGPDRRIGAQTNTSTLATFTVGGVPYILRRIYWDVDDADLDVYMTAEAGGSDQADADAAISALSAYHLEINNARVTLGDATLTSGTDPLGGQNTTSLEWSFDTHLAAAPIGLDSENAVTLYEPLDSGNFVPGSCARSQITDWNGTAWECMDLPHVPGARQTFTQLTSLIAPQAQDSRYGAPSYFSGFDLDDTDKLHGELHISANITLTAATTGGAANLSFTRQDTESTKNREELDSAIVFMSAVRAATAYANPTNPHGLELVERPVYNVNTHAGTYYLRLIRDSDNIVGLFQWYDGIAGTEGPITLSSNVIATYTPSDAAGTSDGGGGGSSPLLKSISLAPASATENRKTVTANTGAVVLSDWEDLDLVTDATAVGGVTVAGDALVFSQPKVATIQAGLSFEGNASGGGARLYVDIRGQLIRGSTTTTPGHMECGIYHKTSAPGAALTQGPVAMLGNCTFLHAAQASDQLKLQWRAYLQSNSQVDVVAADSGVMVMVQ